MTVWTPLGKRGRWNLDWLIANSAASPAKQIERFLENEKPEAARSKCKQNGRESQKGGNRRNNGRGEEHLGGRQGG